MSAAFGATFELDMLRQQLRGPLRAFGLMVAEQAVLFSEAHADLICDHVLPLLRRFPELDDAFPDLEDEIGAELADAARAGASERAAGRDTWAA